MSATRQLPGQLREPRYCVVLGKTRYLSLGLHRTARDAARAGRAHQAEYAWLSGLPLLVEPVWISPQQPQRRIPASQLLPTETARPGRDEANAG